MLIESLESRRLLQATPPSIDLGSAADDPVGSYAWREDFAPATSQQRQEIVAAYPAALREGFNAGADAAVSGDDARVLMVRGTHGDDVLEVGLDGAETVVRLNGEERRFTTPNGGWSCVRVNAGDGDDVVRLSGINGLSAMTATAEVEGSAGDDRLIGGEGSDTLVGGEGADVLEGRGGADYLSGGDGDDVLRGGSGRDKLFGCRGDDILDGGTDADRSFGGLGKDTADYSSRKEDVRIYLWMTSPLSGDEVGYGEYYFSGAGEDGTDERDLIAYDIENGVGGSGDDKLIGNDAANFLDGGRGKDRGFQRYRDEAKAEVFRNLDVADSYYYAFDYRRLPMQSGGTTFYIPNLEPEELDIDDLLDGL